MDHTRSVPDHPRSSDALARATMNALLDCGAVGVALLRGRPWVHVLVNAAYQNIVGTSPALGRAVTSVLPPEIASNAMLDGLLRTGRSINLREVALHEDHRGEPRSYASLTFLRVNAPDDATGEGAVLVVARDVTEQVHERRSAKLFVLLAEDIASVREAGGTLRNAVARAVDVLDADTASIFLLDADGKRLDGAIIGWDWTRSSFSVDVTAWPTVRKAIEWKTAVYFPRERARDAERGWFEIRGIAATICAPMCIGGRVEGVVFFDFEEEPVESTVGLGVAKNVANECALVLSRAAREHGEHQRPIEHKRPFADVASLVRSTCALLHRTVDRPSTTILAWTPEVALAMIAPPLFEEAFLETANGLVVWAGSGGEVSTSVLTVGADVEIILLATAVSPREPFQLPERTRAILESTGGSALAEPDEGISTRVALRVPGVEFRKE